MSQNTTDVLKLIKHKTIIPVSGNYKISDELNNNKNLNDFLGHINIKEAIDYMTINGCKPLEISEGDVLDIETQKIDNLKKFRSKAISIKNSSKTVPYLKKEYIDPQILKKDFFFALNKMKERAKKYGFSIKTQIEALLIHSNTKLIINEGDPSFCKLTLKMDDRLFQMILHKEEFFDNAQIGCHISFIREPNIYEYDAMTLLQFLHK